MEDLGETLNELTARANPAQCGARGVGPDVAAILLITAGDNPEEVVPFAVEVRGGGLGVMVTR
jgi:hypothetical protein